MLLIIFLLVTLIFYSHSQLWVVYLDIVDDTVNVIHFIYDNEQRFFEGHPKGIFGKVGCRHHR